MHLGGARLSVLAVRVTTLQRKGSFYAGALQREKLELRHRGVGGLAQELCGAPYRRGRVIFIRKFQSWLMFEKGGGGSG